MLPSHDGVPLVVSHRLAQLPQLFTLVVRLSQPLVLGGVVSQSSRPAPQAYEHLLPSHEGVPVVESHLVPHEPHVSTLVLLLSQPSLLGATPALQSSVALPHV